MAHGQKIELKAEEAGITPKEFVDNVSTEIKRIWDLMNTSYDKFIRTTDADHEAQVQKIFKKLYDQGDIYKGYYEGLYCTPCESFFTESQLVDGKCPDCGRPASANRYTHNPTIAKNETCMSTGIWGDCSTTLKQQAADYTSIPKVIFRKYPLFYMEYTDINAQVGYYNVVSSVFNTDETLLVRAEAYAMKKEYAKAIADMQIWQDAYTTSKVHLTEEAINKFYGNVAYYTPTKPTVKKELHPDFTVEAGTQENMIHFILHARRIQTLHDGLRWGDIKRYGITVYRRTVENRDITVTDTLLPDDPRRAIQLPSDVISAGLQPNPRNK